MVCTTALIVVRPAICIRLTSMTTDPVRIEFSLQNDPRLLEGARMIFAHAAKQSGFPVDTRQEFSVAALEKCREAFASAEEKGRPDSAIHILVGEFADRVEIAIEYSGDLKQAVSNACGPECAPGGSANSVFGKQFFDSVESQSLDGSSFLKVIKHVDASAAKVRTKAQ
jgi:hypothetical protein